MNGTRAPRVRLVGAAALVVILSWAWISPPQACAQLPPLPLPPLPLPPLPGGLVVTITDPASDSKVSGPITYPGDWRPADPRAWSGGTAVVAETAGAQATFAFTGTSVNWIGFRGPQTGIARVFLDGVVVADVDTYSPTEEVQAVVFVATSLANTNHTLTIEVTGLQNSASTAAYVVVDAFDITPC